MSEPHAHWLLDLWAILTPRQRWRVASAQALSIVMAFSTVAGIASVAPFFAVLGNPVLIDQSAILHGLYGMGFASRRSFTLALAIGFAGLVLLANLINLLGSFVMARLTLAIGTDLQAILYAEYLHRPYVFHARTPSAAIFNKVVNETTRTTNHVLLNLFCLVTYLVTALLIIAAVIAVSPGVAAAMILVLAGGYCLIYLAVRNRLLAAGETESRFFTEQTQVVAESVGAIKEILILRIQDFFMANFERSSRAVARAAAHTQLIGQSPRYVMECVAVVGLVTLVLRVSGPAGIGPWLGKLTFLGFAAYRLLPTLQQAFLAMVKIRSESAAFTSIAADLKLARARGERSEQGDPAWAARPRSNICLRNVSFCYEADAQPAVNQLSLTIAAGTVVAFVGANGSGKTTAADLLAGLLDPAAGYVEVDGIPIDGRNRVAWQTRLAYVPQQVFLRDASIAQNVALSGGSAPIDQNRLRAAATLAHLDRWVADLPRGYEHPVGERGMRLSGGQRQRIGIARALYRDASVLILDEATNALDGLTEREMLGTIARLRGRYTVVLIAHRLSTVRSCDEIFEFDRGSLVGSGTYEGLVRRSISFRRLVAAS